MNFTTINHVKSVGNKSILSESLSKYEQITLFIFILFLDRWNGGWKHWL